MRLCERCDPIFWSNEETLCFFPDLRVAALDFNGMRIEFGDVACTRFVHEAVVTLKWVRLDVFKPGKGPV